MYHYGFRGYAADSMTVMPYPLLVPVAKYGSLGVNLFFMISGFVILMTAARGSLRRFVVSRAVRLYRAFWACCTLTFLAKLLIGGQRYTAGLTNYLVNMTMMGGFVGARPVDGVYWTLFVEMRFYALVAVVLLLGRIRHAEPLLALWLVASVVLRHHLSGRLDSFLVLEYSTYFIAGAVFYLVWSDRMTWPRAAMLAGSWCLAMYHLLRRIPWLNVQYHTSFSPAVTAGLVTCFYIAMLLVALGKTGPIGRRNWITLGALTYPLYLVHAYVGYMVFNLLYPRVNAHVLLWGTVAAMLALAWAVHVQVERRFAGPMKDALNRRLDALGAALSRLRQARAKV